MYTNTSSPFRRIFSKEAFSKAIHSFSSKQWYAFLVLLGALTISALLLLNMVNNNLLVEVPLKGGSIKEGVVGTPRFINPVLAVTDVEKDITSIVYSGLMKKTADGNIVPDLTSTYEVSPDGLTYTFTIRDDAFFQDGSSVEAKDIAYTIKQIQNPVIKSPKKSSWDGVTVTEIDSKKISFSLKQPYSGIIENTTVGIFLFNSWKNIPDKEFSLSNLNTASIGSGPYKITGVKNKKSSSIPYSYELEAFSKYVGGEPYIKDIEFSFYASESEMLNAYKKGGIDQMSAISPSEAKNLSSKNMRIEEIPLSRIFGLFFNQSQAPIFTDKTVVQALELAIDKQAIVDTILGGYGEAIDSPIQRNILAEDGAIERPHGDKQAAEEMLTKAGWAKDENGILIKKSSKSQETTRLSFAISTGDAPELRTAAEMIQKDLQSIGAEVELKVFETGNLNQNVIRPRSYDALFFGQVVNKGSDLFAFWHSSQRNDPGLNVAQYANTKVDDLLNKSLTENNTEIRNDYYKQIEGEIKKDMPAIFVYSPHFIYIVKKNLSGFHFDSIVAPNERFLSIADWYVDTDKVWKIFAPKQ